MFNWFWHNLLRGQWFCQFKLTADTKGYSFLKYSVIQVKGKVVGA
jgi:hypothetical protein